MSFPDIAIPQPLVFAALVVRDAFSRFQRHRCTTAAAAIAFHVLFSIFPLILLIAVIFGAKLRDQAVRERVTDALMNALPLAQADVAQVDELLLNATRNLPALGILSAVGLIWSASGMLGAVRGAMELAWEGRTGTRPFVHGKLIDALLLGVIVVFVLASFFVGIVFAVVPQVSFDWLPDGSWLGVADVISSWAGPVISIATTTIVITVAYKLLPQPRPSGRYAIAGGVVAGLLLELLRIAFGIWVSSVARYDVIYGSIGSIIAFLFFVYLAAIVILVGAEIGASVRSIHTSRQIVLGDRANTP